MEIYYIASYLVILSYKATTCLNVAGWAWGDPHFTTIDGRTYTFNGLGEYVLLRINSINFEIQGRATKLVNESNATFFTALAIGTINTNDIVQASKIAGHALYITIACM